MRRFALVNLYVAVLLLLFGGANAGEKGVGGQDLEENQAEKKKIIDITNGASLIDRNTVVFRRRFDVDVARLWRAVTVKEELDQWWWKTKMELKENGKYAFGGWEGRR